MRALAEYGMSEWASGAPLLHGLKRVRNVALERSFRALPAAGHNRFMADLSSRNLDTVNVVIAFNTPWVIEQATRINVKNITGTMIVCDNSRDAEARRQIEQICRERDVP